jgi:hypothetical protein|tara:strand:+ start:343 stop:870 length:528 start_codon:yes stop_codon:yes gene_type:complete
MTLKMESLEPKWTPMKALTKADEYIKNLPVQPISIGWTKEYDVDFSNLMNSSNRELETFITMFGGYRAYLETELAGITAKKGALEAAFDEGFATASYTVSRDREEGGQKKLTKEELRGAILLTYDGLRELRRDVIELEVAYTRVGGLLNTYKAAYDAVSRVVTLRTMSKDGIKLG